MRHAFDDYIVDTDRREILSAGNLVVVEPKSFDLLVYLLENHDRVVTKEELIDVIWQGRFVSDAAVASAVSASRRSIGDDGKRQHYIKTVRSHGFRFVGTLEPSAGEQSTRTVDRDITSLPSIAVLPFTNSGPDSDDDYIADAICEDITTSLGRIGWLLVIATTSPLARQNKPVNPQDAARGVNVRYLLLGSAHRSGSRIRVSVRLLEAKNLSQVWAERFDRDFKDVFAIQDEITKNVVSALEPQVSSAEIKRAMAKSDQDLNAWDCVNRALAFQSKFTRTASDEAIVFLRRALHIDPGYARAHSQLAWITAWRIHQGWDSPEKGLKTAIEAAENAVKFDTNEPWAYIAWLFIATITRDAALLLNSPRRALEINPNFAMAHSWMGAALALTGNGSEAFEWIERARELSPRDLFQDEFDVHESYAHFQVGDYRSATEAARRAIMPHPNHVYPRLVLASALGHLGDIEAGTVQIARILELAPEMTLASARKSCVFIREADFSRFIDGLRRSGL